MCPLEGRTNAPPAPPVSEDCPEQSPVSIDLIFGLNPGINVFLTSSCFFFTPSFRGLDRERTDSDPAHTARPVHGCEPADSPHAPSDESRLFSLRSTLVHMWTLCLGVHPGRFQFPPLLLNSLRLGRRPLSPMVCLSLSPRVCSLPVCLRLPSSESPGLQSGGPSEGSVCLSCPGWRVPG